MCLNSADTPKSLASHSEHSSLWTQNILCDPFFLLSISPLLFIFVLTTKSCPRSATPRRANKPLSAKRGLRILSALWPLSFILSLSSSELTCALQAALQCAEQCRYCIQVTPVAGYPSSSWTPCSWRCAIRSPFSPRIPY